MEAEVPRQRTKIDEFPVSADEVQAFINKGNPNNWNEVQIIRHLSDLKRYEAAMSAKQSA